jgi:N-acetylglucosaminyl-diphospho-decaprenol L-rhamnosyltransferase
MRNNVFFIIVTYNSEKHINNCINSIKKFEPNSNILVVDNNSIDKTKVLLKSHFGITVLESEKNLGFGKANNIGIEFALKQGADYFYLLNDDAYLVESITSKLIDYINSSHDVGIVTPIQCKMNCQELEVNFEKFLFQQGILSQMMGNVFNGSKINSVYKVDFFQAASWFIPAKVILKVGGFNPIFFHYGEDNDFVNRLKYYKLNLYVITDLKIVHIGNPLNNNYNNNYDKYHINRIKSSWLVQILDLNGKINLIVFGKDFLKLIILSFKYLIKLQVNKFLAIFKLLIWKLLILKDIEKYRNNLPFQKINSH